MQQLRVLKSLQLANDGSRSLLHSILVPEVKHTLEEWRKDNAHAKAVLIGGVALSFYIKPRYTEDADFLYLHVADIPKTVKGFKAHRKGAFEEVRTQVEVETVSHESFNGAVPISIIRKVFDTAVTSDSIKVASKEGLVALKLYASRHKDDTDIVELLKAFPYIELDDWPLGATEKAHLKHLRKIAENEKL